MPVGRSAGGPGSELISLHFLVLLLIARDATSSTAELAARAAASERNVARVLDDLVASGHVDRRRVDTGLLHVIDPTAILQMGPHTVDMHVLLDALARLGDPVD
jgi:CTP-dependent riboflavin kinase